jgi:methylenetetrahydrofolate dehydrogenase (NADP+)/methenyltetrahydrofolate cyclohydrolase
MIIDGRKIAQTIEDRVKEGINHLKKSRPALAFVRVGEDPASIAYLRMKRKKCSQVGIESVDIELPEKTPQEALLAEIHRLNGEEKIDGILVQLPLPSHINTSAIIEAIEPSKDVDGFHPLNAGKLMLDEPGGFWPCTPYGIVVLLKHAGIDPFGKHVVIVGRSNLVGKPLSVMLSSKQEGCNATVTLAHSKTANLTAICRSADILIAAIGQPQFITEKMVKEGAVVIDVGINRTEKGLLVGDVDYENVAPKCRAITPVPGGVGPMTIALLLSNTLLSYQRRHP